VLTDRPFVLPILFYACVLAGNTALRAEMVPSVGTYTEADREARSNG
jgi:hypothetical protein